MMFTISNTTKKKTTISPTTFSKIKKHILGEKYDLSLVICGSKLAKTANARYRGKSYVPNVLSFPLSKNDGEILVCLDRIEKEASEYEMNTKKFFVFLFIHGCLHLKGLSHGAKMDQAEKRLLKQFN